MSRRLYAFGPFRLDTAQRVLTRDGALVPLKARAFDVLLTLAQASGQVLTKEDILTTVWRGVIVEENNLAVQISGLRKALGEYADGSPVIVTVANRGYRLGGEVRESEPPQDAVQIPRAVARSALVQRRWAAGLAAAAATGCALFATAFLLIRGPAPDSAPRLSLAILPFRNLSADRADDALADSVSDDLTTQMAHVPAATVAARQSSDAYRRQPVAIQSIAQALHVRYVLEGSLRRAAGSVAVNAQLIEGATGTHIWAERFDVPDSVTLDAQTSIVFRIASSLNGVLIAADARRSIAERPDDPDFMDLYLRGMAMRQRMESMVAVENGRLLLRDAIHKRPDFVPALAEFGTDTLLKNSPGSGYANPDEVEEARRAITRALALARRDPYVLIAQGCLFQHDGQMEAAAASFQSARAIDAGNALAVSELLANEIYLAHWPAAWDWVKTLERVDPGRSGASYRQYLEGLLSVLLGRPADAPALIRQGLAAWPDPAKVGAQWDPFGEERQYLIAAEMLNGDEAAAKREYTGYAAIWPNRTVFRINGGSTKAQAHDPATLKMTGALAKAGMPSFADERQDFGVAPVTIPEQHALFDPTPLAVGGVATIDTSALQGLLRSTPPPVMIDMGNGAARPAGALYGDFDPLSATSTARFLAIHPELRGPGETVVVLGDGPLGWISYNAVLQLKAAGLKRLIWYRGGEEAWAQHGLPATDERAP